MAHGPRYRVTFRRRREGKTNYHRRIKMIMSRRNRLVIRCSKKHTIVQVIRATMKGDEILSQAHSTQLAKNCEWFFSSGNLPSAYLTGFLCGIRSKSKEITDAILDVGVLIHDQRVKAAFKGFLDANIEVPHDDSFFSENLADRLNGTHIQAYAELLSAGDPKLYKKFFNNALKQKADPLKIVEAFDRSKSLIEKMGA